MIPTLPPDHTATTSNDDCTRFFLDDNYDAGIDADWWLDLGCVAIPAAQPV